MTSAPRARTGQVTPAPDPPGGARVEQVGWGVARQVARLLVEQVGTPSPGTSAFLDRVVERAEAPGSLAYAVFLGRTAVALALVELPAGGGDPAAYAGDVVGPDAPDGTRASLLVRALHDAAAAGAEELELPAAWPPGDAARPGGPEVDLRALGFC